MINQGQAYLQQMVVWKVKPTLLPAANSASKYHDLNLMDTIIIVHINTSALKT